LFRGISHLTKYKDGKGGHPPFLHGGEGRIERVPCIGKLLEIGSSLSQGLGAPLRKLDRITVAEDFDRTAITQFT
jgi:hypothetical protein